MGIRNIQKPNTVPSVVIDRYYDKNQRKWFDNTISRSMFLLGYDVQNGQTNPGYKDRILKGIDAGSNYTRRVYNCTPGLVRMMSNTANYEGYRFETYYPSPLPSVLYDTGSVATEASSRLKRKLREFTGQSNQLTNVAELRELPKTIGGLVNSATTLVKSVSNSRRRGASLKNWASDQWLNWSFGILPTLAAVDDAVSSVNSYLARDDHMIREYGVYARDWKSSNQTLATGSYGALVERRSAWYHDLSCKITAGYRFNLKSANNYTMAKHLGFDISSVIPTAWELLPYSWLVDYFTTAGSFLEDTFSGNPGNSIYLYQTIRYRVTGEETYKPKPNAGTQILSFYMEPTKFSYFELTRTALGILPHAPLRFKTRDEVANNAINKLLNLTAILGSKK